ncbi:hypothetical protein GOP47_0020601 [Adiantum capillus-veneris]|uniref:cAMP-regulated phosphoprotein 19-related protein n=1 Tax=Adiantum capillus-veneris TaxID=13818 RepID=A0A9D4UBD1_ADICA|nr:hypothetical protein GOP47_0020601 [Adiantum capillus-veneris]
MAEVEENKADLAEHPAEDLPSAAEQPMPTPEEQEAAIKKKYGGLRPRKPPLISKDHERAYFDSADWALGKGEQPGQKPKTLVEVLRPKLQPTHHQPLPARRASYETAENEDGVVAPAGLTQEASEGH